MTQTRTLSMIEALVGTAIGFIVSMIASHYVYPAHGHAFTFGQNLSITAIFTVISIVRGYCVRRLFNRLKRKAVVA
jgi:hypothetical protein